MYSIIFTLDKTNLTEEQQNLLKRKGCSWLSNCEGMRTIKEKEPYIAIAPTKSVINEVINLLSQINNPIVIGIWNQDGTQQGHVRNSDTGKVERVTNEDIISSFNQNLYLEHMNDVITLDVDGDEISRARPVKLKQIDQWAGWGERDLNIIK